MTARRLLFTAAIGLNALLLFLVQPLVARPLLPIFGGAPAVWNVTLLFFQSVLILGYLSAHRGPERLGRRPHGIVHLLFLLLGAGAALALRGPVLRLLRENAPGTSAPIAVLLLGLTLLVGLPYFALSAGSPLLQRWFAATDDPRAGDPYFLYAASNVGSLLGLLAYPFALEPNLLLLPQWRVWIGGIVAAAALIALCLRRTPVGVADDSRSDAPPVTRETRASWLVLAAVPSVLLMGSSVYLTSNIAPVPLVWILPLGIYLVSFILAFADRQFASAKTLGRAFALIATPLLLTLALESSEPIALLGPLHLIALLLGCWMCHRKLAESRPPATGLTGFYLTMSVGGAIGGVFASIVAPVIFNSYIEYPLAIVAALALRPALREGDRLRPALLYGAGAIGLVVLLAGAGRLLNLPPSPLRTGLTMGVPLLLAFAAYDLPRRSALMTGGAFFAVGLLGLASQGRVILSERSFFGVHRVVQEGTIRSLVHGTIYHGRQDARHPYRPLTYYHRTGPIGQVMLSPIGAQAREVGLVGLGVGSLAAYGRPGQRMRYFEIDPEVIRIARDPALFTFLRDTKADLDVVAGDARLTLARDERRYDLLVLDAFSSDAIPVHLLTREALRGYRGRLAPGGVIAFHVSNRFLDLVPSLAATAAAEGMAAFDQTDGPSDEEIREGKTESHWMLLAPDPRVIKRLGKQESYWSRIEPDGTRPWTDDYSPILGAMKSAGE